MKRIFVIISFIMILLMINNPSYADEKSIYYYAWENTHIFINKGESIYDYLDLPRATLYNNGSVIDDSVSYLKGDSLTSISSINTSKCGVYTLSYTAICQGIEDKCMVTFEVIVNDHTSPIITLLMDINVHVNEVIDYSKYFLITDSESNISEIKYLDNVDNTKPGTYKVYVTAIDESNNSVTKDFNVIVVDNKIPTITLIKDPVIEYGSSFNILEYIKAIDDYDGIITDKVVYSSVDTALLGSQNIKLTVTDTSGNTTSINQTFIIVDSEPPQIKLQSNKISISVLDAKNFLASDYLSYVSEITDNETPYLDLTIEIDDSKVLSAIGIYPVLISVSDNSNNSINKELQVSVFCDSIPEIVLLKDIKINIGSTINYYSYLSASDTYDGDITDSIVIDDSRVDTNSEGIYLVGVSVKNSYGKYNYKTIQVVVNKKKSSINYSYIIIIALAGSLLAFYIYKKRKKKR